MIRSLFLSMGELNKGVRRPASVPPTNLRKVGVLGAGLMGGGIAYVSALAGLDVVLIDRDQEAADKGKAYSDKLISSQIAKGRAKTADKEALLKRITPTADYAELKGCDLVIEAVFEDRAVKEEATKKAQAVVGPDVVFAGNTSTLPITSLAGTSLNPEHFIGVHFFSPVEKMMLTEIIMGEKTDAKALATAMDFVRAIKKTPIVVNDCRGFYVNRCVGNYMVEAHAMVMEGVPPAMIENAAKMAGMPVGPLALNDEVGIDLSWRILQAAKADLGANVINPAQEKLIEESGVPYSIVRATQFFEFVDAIADSATDGDTVRLPEGAFQPIAAKDVATAVTGATISDPVNGITNIAGPEKRGMDDFIRTALAASNDPRQVVGDTAARYFGTPLDEHTIVPLDSEYPTIYPTRYSDWKASRTPSGAH